MKRNLLKIILLLYIVNHIYAQTPVQSFPDLKPYYIIEENVKKNKILTAEDFMRLSLLASGSSVRETDAYMITLKSLWQGMSPETLADPENIFLFLHEHIFMNYSEHQTEISTVFDTGVYNCVSSSVIYMGFLKYAGFRTSGIAVPDHAFCTVIREGEEIDVETTNPMGFDPGKKTSFTDSFGRETGYTYVPPGQYRKRTVLNDLEFLSLILQNRIHLLQNRNRHKEVISLAAQIYEMTDKPGDFDQFILMIANWLSWLDRKGRQEEALVFLADYSRGKKLPQTLKKSAGVVLNNRVLALLKQNKKEEAGLVLKQYRHMADQKLADSLGVEVRRQIFFTDVYEQPDYESALLLIQNNSEVLSSSEVSAVKDSISYNEMAGIYTSLGAADAYEWWLALDISKSKLHKSRKLSVQIKNSLVNDFHNLFAAAFNRKQWDLAERILKEANEFLGDHSLLTRDRQLLKKATRDQ